MIDINSTIVDTVLWLRFVSADINNQLIYDFGMRNPVYKGQKASLIIFENRILGQGIGAESTMDSNVEGVNNFP